MKNIFLLLTFFVGILCFLFSCKTTNPGPVNQIVTSDTSSTTGYLTVRVYDGNSSVSDATVDLFINYADANAGVLLLRGYSTSSGYVDFGYLNYGNYYVKAQKDLKSKIIPVQVQAKKRLTYNINLN